VQTFLPYSSFERSAAVLDDARLGKQRVEALQILRALHVEDYGWANHPAVRMWRGYTRALVAYGIAVVDEWYARGRPDTTRPLIEEFAAPHPPLPQHRLPRTLLPAWLGAEEFHRAHQSALVRKDPAYYRERFPGVPDDLPYEWPPGTGASEPEQPFSAWVVRGRTSGVAEAGERDDAQGSVARSQRIVGAQDRVALDPRLSTVHATPKQRRQRQAFEHVMRPHQPVAVPGDGHLLVGVLGDGPATLTGAVLTRPVTWRRTVRRRELRRPYLLQDPRSVFALRGEPLTEV
jgi:hypothetical protein